MMKKKNFVGFAFVLVALVLVLSTAPVLAASDYTVMTAAKPDIGGYLVDGQGMALYYFTKDDPGVSNCKGNCSVIWPPFYAAKIVVPEGLNPSDFGTITRDDGMKQTTFKGWPLYYFNKDMASGDIKGQKVNDVWFLVIVK